VNLKSRAGCDDCVVTACKSAPPGQRQSPDPAALEQRRLSAVGTVIGNAPVPYRLDYELATGVGFVTRLLRVNAAGQAWSRSLQLQPDGDGNWSADTSLTGNATLPNPGPDAIQLTGHSTLTSVCRRCSTPCLSSGTGYPAQRYTHVCEARETPAVVLFESVGEGEGLRAEIQFDPDGLVVGYPQIATRFQPAGLNVRPHLV
jgi:uncharacterized protein